MKIYSFLLLIMVCTGYNSSASSFNDSLLTGNWKGSSLCQVKSSPCHDEIAMYHISKGEKAGTYQFIMNKIVNGKEEDMGVLQYIYDENTHRLTNTDESHKAVWKFTVKGNRMEGTLMYKGELYRIIKLERQ